MLTQQQLHKLYEYSPITGIFVHRYDHGRAVAGMEVGWVDGKGYRRTKYRGVTYFMHKLAWLYIHGVYPDELDHWDGDPGNNRIINLRPVTRSQNLSNADTAVSASGVRGVHRAPNGRSWRAVIHHERSIHYLGQYDSVSEARAAYVAAADMLYGQYALHNRPREI